MKMMPSGMSLAEANIFQINNRVEPVDSAYVHVLKFQFFELSLLIGRDAQLCVSNSVVIVSVILNVKFTFGALVLARRTAVRLYQI